MDDRTDDPANDVVTGIGARLHALRRSRGETLEQLAGRTGLTTSTLSRLENDRRRPSLDQLVTLARVFGVRVDDLLGSPSAGDPRIHLQPVTRHGLTYVPLTRRAGGIQAFKVIYPPASRWGPPQLKTHEGYEWFYVMNGSVTFILRDQVYDVSAGQAAEFDTRTPHWIGSSTEQPAELLALMGPQGERTHLTVPGAGGAP